ncbi:MAG: hypothetical protein K2X01_10710 [Cyanobacteria bacterium]|nr:hypothetical protein [Cyanobacteriota bacterium]
MPLPILYSVRLWLAAIVTVILIWPAFIVPAFARRGQDGNVSPYNPGVWDGIYTEGKSGTEGDLNDPKNSEGKTGVSPDPQHYYIPPPRYFYDVEKDDITVRRAPDYNKDALVTLMQPFRYQNQWIPKGYYHVHLGKFDAGSEKHPINLSTEAAIQPPELPRSRLSRLRDKTPLLKSDKPPEDFHSVIFKQLGRVIAVLPITNKELYEPQKGQVKQYKKPKAIVVFEQQHPVLKIVYRRIIYSCQLPQ